MFNGFVFYVADDEQLNVNVDPKSGRAKYSHEHGYNPWKAETN